MSTRLLSTLDTSSILFLEETRRFLQRYFADTDLKTAQNDIQRVIASNPQPIWQGLIAIEGLLEQDPPESILMGIILWDVSQDLKNPSEHPARAYLVQVLRTLRRTLRRQNYLAEDTQPLAVCGLQKCPFSTYNFTR